jgi:hypothetical protein
LYQKLIDVQQTLIEISKYPSKRAKSKHPVKNQ